MRLPEPSPTVRRWAQPRQPEAGRASAALLLVVWVGNVQMALDATGTAAAVAWARVPLQVPLVWAALQERPARG